MQFSLEKSNFSSCTRIFRLVSSLSREFSICREKSNDFIILTNNKWGKIVSWLFLMKKYYNYKTIKEYILLVMPRNWHLPRMNEAILLIQLGRFDIKQSRYSLTLQCKPRAISVTGLESSKS